MAMYTFGCEFLKLVAWNTMKTGVESCG